VVEGEPVGRQPGWGSVLVVAAVVVALVLGAAMATSLLPTSAQEVIFHTPLTILVLLIGTAWVLWRITRPRR
jgi:hypothetical protein